MYYSETLDRVITDKAFRIVKIGARPTWHIYGISKKEYHKRMKDLGFLVKEADILVKDFKQELLILYILVLRRVEFSLSLCCRNVSPDKILGRATDNLVYCEVSSSFDENLDEWVRNITNDAWKKYTIECSMLQGGSEAWEPEVCKHETNGFVNGIKIIAKGELMKPKKEDQRECEKESSVISLLYKDWGTGAWNKWSGYEKPVIHGVRTYVN